MINKDRKKFTNIRVTREIANELDKLRQLKNSRYNKSESYDDVLRRLLKIDSNT